MRSDFELGSDVMRGASLAVWRTIVVALTLLFAGAIGAGRPRGWPRLPGSLWGAVGPVYRLFAPTSGALLAAGDSKLVRSDDGGASWRDVSLPPGADLSFAVGTSCTPRATSGRVGSPWTRRTTTSCT